MMNSSGNILNNISEPTTSTRPVAFLDSSKNGTGDDYDMDYGSVDDVETLSGNQTISKGSSCLRFQFLCSILMAILCLVGIFGNIVSFLIFTRRCMRSPINVLLSGLSLVDTSVLAIAIPVYVVPGLNFCDAFGSLARLHVVIVFGLYQLAMVAQTCSVWTFVLISIER